MYFAFLCSIIKIGFDCSPIIMHRRETTVFVQTARVYVDIMEIRIRNFNIKHFVFSDCLQFSKTVLNMQKEPQPTAKNKLVKEYTLLLLFSSSSRVFILHILMSSRQCVAC